MPRYKTDLHSIIKNGRLSQKHFLIVASQIIGILKNLHSKQYVHSDIKAENIMIGLFRKLSNPARNDNRHKSQHAVQFGGANPYRNCRSLRPSRTVTYAIEECTRSTHYPEESNGETSDNSIQDEDFELSPKKRKTRKSMNKAKAKKITGKSRANKKNDASAAKNIPSLMNETTTNESFADDKVFVIDYGLATKFIDTNGEHKPFCMDQRRAHDGTLEFTSRDAHFGAHSRRSDLECLGYNLIYWSCGFLPWKDDKLKEQPEIVHRLKELFMTDVKETTKILYGKNFPRYLIDYMQYVTHLEFDAEPDYEFLKTLFDKEYVKLGHKKSEMKLNLDEMREECEPNDNLSENDLMMSTITDVKSARKLGFLIATDCVDGIELLSKPNESTIMNLSCKASPKNLRSKGKASKGKRPKRQPKLSEKLLISEKMAQGRKLSIAEIATLDPDQIARERADREYEKFDEKVYYQTPKRYKGNATYAILEIENRLKNKHNGSVLAPPADDIEPIKGYTKPMMDVLKRQQITLEQQQQATPITSGQPKRNQLRNVIKPAAETKAKKTRQLKTTKAKIDQNAVIPKTIRGKRKAERAPVVDIDDNFKPEEPPAEIIPPVKRKRGRPKIIRQVIEPPETEEDSVYYDIPGEGSNDGVKEMSDDDNEPIILSSKPIRGSSEENSNQASTSNRSSIPNRRKLPRSYYADDDYDASTDEATNLSSATNVTMSSFHPRSSQTVGRDVGIATRTKTKSRSTSRSAAALNEEPSDQSEYSESVEKDSEYNAPSGEETEEEQEQATEMEFELSETEEEEEDEDMSNESEIAESNDSNDSIDIKYSPIKTRHARRRVNHFNLKQIRGKLREMHKDITRNHNIKLISGRRINVIDDNSRNFRLVSTQG